MIVEGCFAYHAESINQTCMATGRYPRLMSGACQAQHNRHNGHNLDIIPSCHCRKKLYPRLLFITFAQAEHYYFSNRQNRIDTIIYFYRIFSINV